MALVLYLATISSSDNNGGSSEAVIVSDEGTADVVQSDATVDLSDGTPDLSGVNQEATHDTIRIEGRTDGINDTDIFEIIAVETGGQYTVEVSPTPTDAGTSNLDWCIGGQWATPQKGADVIDDGDILWIKADGDYTDDGDSDDICMKLKQSVSVTTRIAGYKTTIGDADDNRGDDDYRAVINGTPNGLTNCLSEGALTGSQCYVFENLYLKNASTNAAAVPNSSALTFKNCRFSASQSGCNGGNSSNSDKFEECVFDNNSAVGAYSDGMFIGCDFYDNSGVSGLSFADNSGIAVSCRFWGSQPIGIRDASAFGGHTIINNTLDGAGVGTGIFLGNANNPSTVVNNIIYDWVDGIKSDVPTLGARHVVRNNLFHDNNTDRTNFPVGMGDVSGDPLFVDADNDDYRLASGSPAINAGYPAHADIGACQVESADLDEIHLLKALVYNRRTKDISTGVLTIYDDDDETVLAIVTPSESGGVVTLTPDFQNSARSDDAEGDLHKVKALFLNKRLKRVEDGRLIVKDDDGSTTLFTLTPSTAAGVVTVESS